MNLGLSRLKGMALNQTIETIGRVTGETIDQQQVAEQLLAQAKKRAVPVVHWILGRAAVAAMVRRPRSGRCVRDLDKSVEHRSARARPSVEMQRARATSTHWRPACYRWRCRSTPP